MMEEAVGKDARNRACIKRTMHESIELLQFAEDTCDWNTLRICSCFNIKYAQDMYFAYKPH